MDWRLFVENVRDALGHLDQPSQLANHPLTAALGTDVTPISVNTLRRALLDAIEQSGHKAGIDRDGIRARQHRQLVLRFVEGQRRENVAREVGLSVRQATRDLDRAVEQVARIIWSDYFEVAPTIATRDSPSTEDTDLDAEFAHEVSKIAAQEGSATDLAETIAGALKTVRQYSTERGVLFTTSILDTLPAVAISRTVLRQALINLFMFVADRYPKHRLTITATDTANGLTLRVSASTTEKSESRPPPGQEAMMLIEAARRLLATQGGEIHIEAETTYDGAAEKVGPRQIIRVTVPPIALRKVLVVDDNPDVVRLFQRYLTGEPYRLIQATSGDSAHHLAIELRPDAIILDVMLPAQDGWEILQRLRDDPSTDAIPVIICSILPERALAMSLGVNDFLPKPVMRGALRSTLERWCRPPAEKTIPP